jgi:subtilase family serine protease
MLAILKFKKLSFLLGLVGALSLTHSVPSFAEAPSAIIGNHPTAAENETPIGTRAADAQLAMAVTLQLRDPAGAKALLAQLQDPASANYHQWLTSAQFAARFDPTEADVAAVVAWLADQGFTIVSSSSSARLVRFTGTVAQAQQSFHTTIYNYGDGSVFGNIEDPIIPAQLAGVIAQIHGLDNMRAAVATSHFVPRFAQPPASLKAPLGAKRAAGTPEVYAALSRNGSATDAAPAAASSDASIGGFESFGPADFQTFFDETPLATNGINGGGGDCIAIVGDSDFEQSSVDNFNSYFGNIPSTITTEVVNSSDPGFNNDELEALLDLEWSHAVAPGAATRFYVGNSSAAVIAPIVDQISQAVNDNLCGVISASFGLCGGAKSFYTNTVSPIYAQAALQGQSIFISSGDQGAAGLTFNSKSGCIVGTSRNVSQLAADPNITAVGGASFDPTYDGSGNDTSVVASTALRVWDDPNDGIPSGGATGGGASADYAKPAYQYGLGVPNDNKRDLPDVVLIASPYFPGVFTYMDDSCFSFGCDGAGTPVAAIFGGTSLAAPSWAGIAKLVAQQNNVTRLGALNPRIYQLANSTSHGAIFQDVTSGNNKFGKVSGYAAGPGFDLATGWGTVDINALATTFFADVTPLGPQVLTLSPASLNFGNVDFAVAGAANKVKKLTITNPKKYEATLQIDSIVGSDGFTVDGCNNVTIPPGGKQVCNITYTPTAFGAANGTLTITSNAGTSPQAIAVTGVGILGKLTATPGSLNFGKVALSTASAAKTVTLKNTTGSTFTISSITNTNPDFVPSQNCVAALGAAACAVSVTYTPSVASKEADTLTITDVPDGITKTVNLSGTGD